MDQKSDVIIGTKRPQASLRLLPMINESEEEKEKVLQKKRRITQEKESGERKLVNLPNEEGVGVVLLLMENPRKEVVVFKMVSPFLFHLKIQI